MTRATWTVKVNWNGDGSTMVDETSRVSDFTIARGRNNEQAVMDIGQATLSLQNNDGRFNPENSSGPLFGQLDLYRKVQISAVLNAVTYYLFTGYITRLQPHLSQRTVTLTCQDAFCLYKKVKLNMGNGAHTVRTTSQVFSDILAAGGAAEAQNISSSGQLTLYGQTVYFFNADLLSALQELADNELGGQVFMDGQGNVCFRSHQYRALQLPGGATGTVNNTGEVTDYQFREDMVYKQAILQMSGWAQGQTGAQIWSYSPLPLALAPGEVRHFEVLFPSPDSAVSFSPDYLARDSSTPGGGSDITASVAVSGFAAYNGGAVFDLTNNATVTAYLQKLQILAGGTQYVPISDLRVVNKTTVGSNVAPYAKCYQHSYRLLNDITIGGAHNRSDLGGFAEYLVNRYTQGRPVVKVKLEPYNDAQYAQMLGYDLNTLVTIVDNDAPHKTQLNKNMFIERVEHQWRAQDSHLITTWTLTDYLVDMMAIYDTSLYDSTAAPYGY